MRPSIRAICFDVGGTLRITKKSNLYRLENIQEIQAIIQDKQDPLFWLEEFKKRENEYRIWSRKVLREMTEVDLWHHFMLPEAPFEIIKENAICLNQLWRELKTKVILPDTVDVIKTLKQRGYQLGIISNTTSSVEIPNFLEEYGIMDLFSCVILSAVHGRRKPHPSLFLDFSKSVGVSPANCAYVGNLINRDVIGGRQAGYAEITLINAHGYFEEEDKPVDAMFEAEPIQAMQPDYRISKLSELLNIYPERNSINNTENEMPYQPRTLYDAALSTMWHVGQAISFNQCFLEGSKLGFPRFELNHKVTPKLFKELDMDKFYISSVHDPCPAIYSSDELKMTDYLISSLDEEKRNKGVDIVKQTIDTAIRLGSRSVVIHPGMIRGDYNLEKRLKKLFEQGLQDSDEYEALKNQMIAFRNKNAAPYVDQVLKSVSELIEFARSSGVEIGLENRYHFFEIPVIEELESLLDLCDEDWYGFQYDIGHAEVMDKLGFIKHEEWLNRFSKRIIGVHIHDVVEVTDHQMPGSGSVNFEKIIPYIPAGANLTMELKPDLNLNELKNALEYLVSTGIISKI